MLSEVRIEAGPQAFGEQVRGLYPGQRPECHVIRITGLQSLLLVGIFRAREHWHYVGTGLRPRTSVELSLRLADRSPHAPTWPPQVIGRYAEHLARGGTDPLPGHYVRFDPSEPSAPAASFALVPDPELAPSWLQLVPLDDAGLARMGGDGWQELIASWKSRNPLFVVEPRAR